MDDTPVVVIRPSSYQPSKAEFEEDVSVDAAPTNVRAAVMPTVTVEESDEAWRDGTGYLDETLNQHRR